MEREDTETRIEPNTQPLCISVPAAARLIGVSRNTGYSMAAMGQLPTIRCGKRRLVVPVAGLMQMLGQTKGSSESEQ